MIEEKKKIVVKFPCDVPELERERIEKNFAETFDKYIDIIENKKCNVL